VENKITNAEKMRGLPWAISSSVANTFFNSLTLVSGTVFVLFLNELGMNKTQLGFTLSLVPFFGLGALFIAPAVAKIGYKKVFLLSWSGRSGVTALFLFTPLVWSEFGNEWAIIFVIIVVSLKSLFQTINVTASMPWVHEFVPNNVRGKFTGASYLWGTIAGMAAVAGAGFVLESSNSINRFTFLIGIGVFVSLFAILAMTKVPGGRAEVFKEKISGQYYGHALFEALRDKNFSRLLIGIGLANLGIVPLLTFLPLYLKEEIALSSGQIVWLGIWLQLGALLSYYIWGWASDRYGSKPIMISSLLAGTIISMGWLFIPAQTSLNFYLSLTLSFLLGVTSGGWIIGFARLLYVSVVPSGKKVQYMAIFQAWIGISTGLSQLFAGRLLEYLNNDSGYFLLFVIRLMLPVLSILFFSSIKADESVSTKGFFGMFIRGNPFMAMESLIGFHRAKNELAAVSMTERMGQAKSPLTVEELLEALSDLRFNVRFEAIISITRTIPNIRLIKSLITVLKSDDPSLSGIAAWALGRIGRQEGIEALRESVFSKHEHIKIQCIRSLGALDDKESIALFLKALGSEDNNSKLQVAYASALGQLGAQKSIPELLVKLKNCNNKYDRKDFAFSIARIIGNESRYIQVFNLVSAEIEITVSKIIFSLSNRVKSAIGDSCGTAWEKGNFKEGVVCLVELINYINSTQIPIPEYRRIILNECAFGLKTHGITQIEYLVLSLHLLKEIYAKQK